MAILSRLPERRRDLKARPVKVDTATVLSRRRIEAKMRCLKAFGERIAARLPDSQTTQIQIRGALINRFNALGAAEIVRVA